VTVNRAGRPLAGLLALLLLGGVAAAEESAVYFSPNGGGAAATAAAIRSATDTIDVAMYSITTSDSNPIFVALEDAVARDVRVRVILNDGHTDNEHKARALGAIGCHVFSVTSTLHEKFALLDAASPDAVLTNGSANWSRGAETKYSENTVVYRSGYAHLRAAFQAEFDRLLAEAIPVSPGAEHHQEPVVLDLPPGPAPDGQRAVFTSANEDPGGPAEGVVTQEIVRAIGSARSSIRIDVAHFDRRPIADAVLAAKQERPWLRIEVLLDQGELSGGQGKRLERAWIPVRYKCYSFVYLHPQSQLMHHKTLIVDDELLVTGSYNYSKTAEFKNFENVVVLSGPENRELVAAFAAEHDRLWAMGREQYEPFKRALFETQPGDPDYQRYVPVHWNTDYCRLVMTLSRWEMNPLYWDFARPQEMHRGSSARFWDRETGEAVDAPGGGDPLEAFVERLVEERGTFLEPKPAPAPAPLEPLPAGGLADALGGLGD